MIVISSDLSRHDPELLAMQARLVAYRRLVRLCPHIDGLRQGPALAAQYWQCMSCGLLATEDEFKKLERWPEPEPKAEALGTALVAWEWP